MSELTDTKADVNEAVQVASLDDKTANNIETKATLIEKPDSNVTDVVSLVGKKNLKFDFNLDDVKIEIENVDLIISFEDGSKIILLDFGLQMASDEQISLNFADMNVSTDELFAKVGEYRAVEVTSVNFSSSETKDDGGQTGENEQQAEQIEVSKSQFETQSPFEGFKGGAGVSEEDSLSYELSILQ